MGMPVWWGGREIVLWLPCFTFGEKKKKEKQCLLGWLGGPRCNVLAAPSSCHLGITLRLGHPAL